jgi:hypothetical protein
MEAPKPSSWPLMIWNLVKVAVAGSVILLSWSLLMNKPAAYQVDWSRPAKPVATVIAVVATESREAFFSRLRTFSATNKFIVDIAEDAQFKGSFNVELTNENIWILGDSLFDPLTFRIDFYPAPGQTSSLLEVQPLVLELILAVSEVARASEIKNK